MNAGLNASSRRSLYPSFAPWTQVPWTMRGSGQESPFGGNVEGLISPSRTTLTNFKEFRPAQSPLHLSSLEQQSRVRSSGTQNPALYSLSSASFRWVIRSSALLGGRPGRRCDMASSSSSLSRAMKLEVDQYSVPMAPGNSLPLGQNMQLFVSDHSCTSLQSRSEPSYSIN